MGPMNAQKSLLVIVIRNLHQLFHLPSLSRIGKIRIYVVGFMPHSLSIYYPKRLPYAHLASSFQLPVDGSTKLSSICTSGQMGQSKKFPFALSSSVSSNPIDLIHCYLWGSSPELSISGYGCYVSFMEDYTKYVWFYPITTKSQNFVTFLKFKAYINVENLYIVTIGFLRSFGCLCFPWLRPYNKNKLERHSKPYVFLGYSLNYLGYLCLDQETSRVYLSWYVTFNETIFFI